MGFIIPSCNVKPTQIGARFFVGGTSFIARCDATCHRTRLLSASQRIVKKTNSRFGNSWHYHFVNNANGDCPMAIFPSASHNRQESWQSRFWRANAPAPRTAGSPESRCEYEKETA